MSGYPIVISRVDRLDCRIEAYDWVYATAAAARIDMHWEGLCAERPALFNGRILLMHDWRIEADGGASVLRSRHFETDFKAFISWRDFGFPDPLVRNCFSMAALRSADGAWLLGVMGEHTSNAGQIYFPAGTPDPSDAAGGMLDLEGSALRELAEETGLAVADVTVQPGWSIADAGPRLGCMKIVTAHEDAVTLKATIEAKLVRQNKPELSGMHIVRSRDDILPARMPDFMTAWLNAELP